MTHGACDDACVYQFTNLKQETFLDPLINLKELEL